MRSPSRIPAQPAAQLAFKSRWNRGTGLFCDESLKKFEFILDEAFRIPGTRVRFGIDGVIGLVPGIGNVLAGILSLIFPVAAWMRGLPYITLMRMVANLGIGILVGSIPFFGDIFDIAWKANRRNYNLLQRHLAQPRRHTWRDWLFLLALLVILAAIFAVPLALLAWLLWWLWRR